MLKGIDVSSWQGDIDINKLADVEFVISKATEGTGYVNPYCDKVIQQCIRLKMPWGFYHYMKANDPIKEANHFINNTQNYFTHGIPVLDWEENQSVDAVNKFVRHVHSLTGIWPWIYANPWRFNQGNIEENCGRWIASYPSNKQVTLDYDPGKIPETKGLVCCWQFSSNVKVYGFNGALDGNKFYGDINAWNRYCGKPESYPPTVENPVENPESNILENDRYIITITEKE